MNISSCELHYRIRQLKLSITSDYSSRECTTRPFGKACLSERQIYQRILDFHQLKKQRFDQSRILDKDSQNNQHGEHIPVTTGYIGGQALHDLYHAGHRNISALVRHKAAGSEVLKAFPQIRIVPGDLDNAELIENEARKADIVLHLASTKHLASSQAIARGLSHASRSAPGYWIQISGASMFSTSDIEQKRYGEAPTASYNDLTDKDTILSAIRMQPARTVDNLVLDQDSRKVKTALIIGPLIYGVGQGPVHTRSIQVPEMAKVTLQKGEGFRVGAGKSVWSNVHVRDLGLLFEKLVDAADESRSDCWNDNGIYAVDGGSLSFGEIGERIAKKAHAQGLIKSPDVASSLTPEEADAAMPHGSVLWATNALTHGERTRKQLGWAASHEHLEDTIAAAVKAEADALFS